MEGVLSDQGTGYPLNREERVVAPFVKECIIRRSEDELLLRLFQNLHRFTFFTFYSSIEWLFTVTLMAWIFCFSNGVVSRCWKWIPNHFGWTIALLYDALLSRAAVERRWELKLALRHSKDPHDHVMRESLVWNSHPSPCTKHGIVVEGERTLPFVKAIGFTSLGSFIFWTDAQKDPHSFTAKISSKLSG